MTVFLSMALILLRRLPCLSHVLSTGNKVGTTSQMEEKIMEDNQSPKKYRGFKYIVLALLVFGAAGFAYFSKGRPQTDNRQADVKEAVSPMVADSKQQGENLMAKASEMKAELGDTMDNGRDKASELASNFADNAEQTAQSATETGAEWVDRVKTAAIGDDAKPGAAQSERPEQQASEMIESAEYEEGKISDRASEAKTTDTLKAEAMINESSQALTTLNEPEAAADRMGGQLAPDGNEGTGKLRAAVDAASTGVKTTTTGKVFPEKGSENHSPSTVSAEGQKQDIDAMAPKDKDPASAALCAGPSPKGKDLGSRYIVASCETMSIISERTGVGIRDLINRNPQVINPDLIYPNQELQLSPRG